MRVKANEVETKELNLAFEFAFNALDIYFPSEDRTDEDMEFFGNLKKTDDEAIKRAFILILGVSSKGKCPIGIFSPSQEEGTEPSYIYKKLLNALAILHKSDFGFKIDSLEFFQGKNCALTTQLSELYKEGHALSESACAKIKNAIAVKNKEFIIDTADESSFSESCDFSLVESSVKKQNSDKISTDVKLPTPQTHGSTAALYAGLGFSMLALSLASLSVSGGTAAIVSGAFLLVAIGCFAAASYHAFCGLKTNDNKSENSVQPLSLSYSFPSFYDSHHGSSAQSSMVESQGLGFGVE